MKLTFAILSKNTNKLPIGIVLLVSGLLAACSALPPVPGDQPGPSVTASPTAPGVDLAATAAAVQATESTRLTAEALVPTATPLPIATPTLFVDPAARGSLSFDDGSTQTEFFGSVEPYSAMEYLIPAGQFQRIEVTLRSADESLALVMLSEDGGVIAGDIEEQTFWRGQMPATTNSILRVIGRSESSIFSILAEVPGKIQLAEETTSESVQGQVSPEDRDAEYLLQPLEGETLVVKVLSPNNDVLLSATGVQDGQLFLGIPASNGGYVLELPDTQDFLIAVLGTGGATTFSLDVSIFVPEGEEEEEVAEDGTPQPVYPLLLATVNDKAVPRLWQTPNGKYSFNANCGYVDTIVKQDPEERIKLPDGLTIWVVEDGSFTFGECLVDISNGIFKGDSGKQWVIIADTEENRENELLRNLIGLPLRKADVIFSQ